MTDRIHLVVATPCFGGQVSSIYATSIFGLQRAIHSISNMTLKVLLRDGDALITRARANLVTQFLDDPTATHLLFVDADIGFEPEQVFRLIESGADVVAGVYPIKRVNWDKAMRMMKTGRPEISVGRTGLRARGRRSRSGQSRQRLHAGALCRHGIPDDPASRVREDVRRLPIAAILPRAFAGYAGGKSQSLCLVRMHDRSGKRNLSQRGFCLLQTLDRYRRRDLGRSREPPRSCRPRRYSAAISRRSSPPRAGRPMRREMQTDESTGVARSGCADRAAWRDSRKWRSRGSIFARYGKA